MPDSPPIAAIAVLAIFVGGSYYLLQSLKSSSAPVTNWNTDHVSYVNLIDETYKRSDGTTDSFLLNQNILLKEQSQKLIAIAVARSEAEHKDYGMKLKEVYHEFYDLHTLKI
jgi:hypothetical protein